MITGDLEQIAQELVSCHTDTDADLISVDHVDSTRHSTTFVVRVTFLAEPPECNVSEFRVDVDAMEVIQL